MCSASNSSLLTWLLACKNCFLPRLAASRSDASRSPGQQRSLHSWRPQFNVTRQVRIHQGGSGRVLWQTESKVFRPHLQLIGTFFKHGKQLPVWQVVGQVCPQANVFPHCLAQFGIGSAHEVRSLCERSVNCVLPQGQVVTTSGDLGQ